MLFGTMAATALPLVKAALGVEILATAFIFLLPC
jgi:hypothetical protein